MFCTLLYVHCYQSITSVKGLVLRRTTWWQKLLLCQIVAAEVAVVLYVVDVLGGGEAPPEDVLSAPGAAPVAHSDADVSRFSTVHLCSCHLTSAAGKLSSGSFWTELQIGT